MAQARQTILSFNVFFIKRNRIQKCRSHVILRPEDTMRQSQNNSPFKVCAVCNGEWATRHDFLSDPSLYMIGYQSDFDHLVLGLFLFNHTCGATLALPAESFTDLHNGPIFHKNSSSTTQNPEYCLHSSTVLSCPNRCSCASTKRIMDIIAEWPRQLKAAGE